MIILLMVDIHMTWSLILKIDGTLHDYITDGRYRHDIVWSCIDAKYRQLIDYLMFNGISEVIQAWNSGNIDTHCITILILHIYISHDPTTCTDPTYPMILRHVLILHIPWSYDMYWSYISHDPTTCTDPTYHMILRHVLILHNTWSYNMYWSYISHDPTTCTDPTYHMILQHVLILTMIHSSQQDYKGASKVWQMLKIFLFLELFYSICLHTKHTQWYHTS